MTNYRVRCMPVGELVFRVGYSSKWVVNVGTVVLTGTVKKSKRVLYQGKKYPTDGWAVSVEVAILNCLIRQARLATGGPFCPIRVVNDESKHLVKSILWSVDGLRELAKEYGVDL